MIKRIRPGIFIIESFFPETRQLYKHVLENEDLFRVDAGCSIKRYDVLPSSKGYTDDFRVLCEQYIVAVSDAVEEIGKIRVYNKTNFIVGFSIYDKGSRIEPHNDLYDVHDQKNNHVLSTVHYLNDNFTGGEIYFTEEHLEIKPIENMLLVFDSRLWHETRAITVGRKISATRFWKPKDNFDDAELK